MHFNLANDRSVVYNNFYDANKTWIGWFTIKGETLVDVPARAVYLRISQVIKELPDFTWYVWDKTDDVIVKAVDDYVIPLNRYVDGYVGTDGNIVTAKTNSEEKTEIYNLKKFNLNMELQKQESIDSKCIICREKLSWKFQRIS